MQEIARDLVNGKKHDLGNLGQLYSVVQDRVHAADLEYEKKLEEASRRLSKQPLATEDIMERVADGFFEPASSDDEAEPKETFPGKRCVQDFPTPENHFYHHIEEPRRSSRVRRRFTARLRKGLSRESFRAFLNSAAGSSMRWTTKSSSPRT
jgi:hypothetical protein